MMERLTEKRIIHPSCKTNGELENREYIHIKDKNLAEKKLFELENIEQELGIDLITLFDKIMKAQKIYFKKKEYRKGKISYSKSFQLVKGLDKKIRLICKCFDQCYYENRGCEFGIILELKDYGKTWAISREELE